MTKLPGLLHLLLCQEQHLYDMMKLQHRHDGICYFYLEEQITTEKPMPDHVKWDLISEKFKSSLNLKSDEEAVEFIRQVIKMSAELRELIDGSENRLKFVNQLLI